MAAVTRTSKPATKHLPMCLAWLLAVAAVMGIWEAIEERGIRESS